MPIGGRSVRRGLSPSFLITMTIFIDLTGFGIIIPLLAFYAATFQAGPASLGILVASFSLMQFIFSPILGKFSDRVGRKPVLLLSISISMVGFLLFSLANSFMILLLSRIIAGMATETAVAQAYIADITSKTERATGMGRVGAALGAGFIVGPAIGGFLSVYGFGVPGFAAVALTVMNLLFVIFFLPESPKYKEASISEPSDSKASYWNRLRNTLSKPLIGAILAIFFFITLAFSTIPVTVPLLGIFLYNIGRVEMSYLFMYIGFVQILLQGFLIQRILRKVSEERLVAFGPLLMMAGMILMPLIPSITVFILSLTMISAGNGILRTVIPSFISKRTSANEQGSILGVTQSVSTIARVPGPLVAGPLYDFALIAPFGLSAVLLFIAFGTSCRVLKACRVQNPNP